MSTKVLDYWRQEEPRFRDVSDDVLTSFIAADSPQFLQDPTFAKRAALVKEKLGTTSPVADAVGSALSAVPDWANASGGDWAQAAGEAVAAPVRAVGGLLSGASRLAGEDANRLTDALNLDRQGLPARAIEQGARTLPVVAGSVALTAMGVPAPLAMGAPMGAQTYAETGDLGAAARATSIGMLLGPAQEFGAAFGSQLAGRAASLTASETAQNAAIALGRVTGSQSMVNGMMVAEQAPDLMALAQTDPAKARDQLILLVAGNLAFEAPHLRGIAREALARSQVESYLKSGDYKAAVDAAARSGGRVRQGEAPVHQGPLGEVPLPEAATGKPALQVAADPISPAPAEGRSQNVAPTTAELRPVAGGSSSPDIIAQLTGRPSAPVDVPPPDSWVNGDPVRYVDAPAPEGFRSFEYLDGIKKGRLGVERTPEAKAADLAEQRRVYDEQQAAFRRIRESGLSDQMPKAKQAEPAPVAVPAAKFDQEMFQGRGASPEAVYGPEAVAEGRAVPILGPGSYYAFSGGDAKTYGTVTKAAVRLKNPLVIDSSRKWADLMAAADAKHLDSGDKWFYAEPQGIAPATLRLKAYVQAQGHDGIIIRGTQLDQNKRLRESFGHDQVVSYEAKPATPSGMAAGSPVSTSTGSSKPGADATTATPPRKPKQFQSREAIGYILDDIESQGGLMSKSEARHRKLLTPEKNGPEYDDVPALKQPTHNFIYGNGRGGKGSMTPDRMAKALEMQHPGKYSGLSVPEMWAAIEAASNGRVQTATKMRRMREQGIAEGKAEEGQQKAFDKATSPTKGGPEEVNVDALNVGDTLIIGGEQVKVVGIDQRTGDVILEDGTKFGRRVVEAGQVLYVEQIASPKTEPIFTGAESVGDQNARMAEEQARRTQQEQQSKLADLAAKPLVGSVGDIGQGDLLGGGDLFSAPGPQSRHASGDASVGGFVEATSKAAGRVFADSPGLGARDVLPANHMPELVRMVTDLLGAAPELKKSLGKALAYFRHNGVSGVIRMRYDQFLHENARELPQLLAHEIGHAVDWLPDRSMKRGNLIGRVRSLRDFLKGSFGELKDKELRQELLGVSQWWRQWDPAKLDDTSRKYFTSGKELYADAVSVLFNSPGDLQARAPKFYEALIRYMDAKPPVKEAFIELQTLLARGPEAVAAERLTRKREGYVKGDEELARILREKEAARTSIKGFMLDVQQTHIDRAALVNQAVKRFHKEGRADAEAAATSAREAWEESLFADNRTALDLAAIFEHSLHPLKDLGLDQHDLGAVIELQRVIGNKDAREQLVAKLGTLGRDQYRRAVALAAEWDRMLAGAGNDPAKLDLIEGAMRARAEEVGLEFDDITEVSKLKAEQGTRAEIANPGGFLPADAEMTLKELLAAKTPGQRGALLSASSEFRKVFNRRVLEAVDAGIYSESFRKLHEANKDTYAAFRSLDHVDDFVSPAIRRAKGTLKDIENPFYTTILKLRSLNNLIARNAALVEWRNLFMREFPESWQKAGRYHDGVRFHDKAPAKGMERLIVREGGKPVAYDVDPHVADAFRDPDRLKGMWRVVDYGFRTGVYPLIIKYNPYFQYISNPLRDASRSSRNLGAMAGWKAELKFRTSVAKRWVAPFAEPFAARSERLRGFLEDWESARNFVKGAPDAIGREMMEVAAIGTPHDSITQLDVRDGFAELMRRYHLAKPEHQGLLRRALTAIPRHIQYAGAIREALPKVAAYRILTRDLGWSPRQAATVVRNYVGTPNHKVKGTLGTLDSTMVPFLNIFLQGYRADTRLATTPKTAGGWWARWAMGDGARAVLQGLAVSGVFGAAAQQLYQGIPENDKSNYDVIPIGSEMGGDFGSRTVYVRIPRDESSRLLAALTYKLTRVMAGDAAGGMAAQDAFRVGEGTVPGVSPLFQVAGAWKDYLGGQNPVDPFRNRPVIPATEFAAGGTAALKPMLTWTLDKAGLLSFVSYNRDAKTTTEMYTDAGTSVRNLARGEGGIGDAVKVAEALPAITKLIKTSDYGFVERQREEARVGAQGKASVRVDYVPEVRGMINEFQNLSRTPHRTEEQAARFGALKAWHREFLKYDEALQKMQQEPSARADVPRIQKEFNNFSRQFVEDVLKRKRGEFKAVGTAEGNR